VDRKNEMKKCALIVGHDIREQGAVSCSGETEFVFNSRLAGRIEEMCVAAGGVELVRVWRAPRGYARLPGAINATGADLAVELHFNAATGLATGTETLCLAGSQLGTEYAKIFQSNMVSAMGLISRGVKPTLASGRGGLFLSKTAMPAVLLEPFFGDNPADWSRANERFNDLALSVARSIREVLL
jgi:N-acetylmuramoyl-L-alanine amidase